MATQDFQERFGKLGISAQEQQTMSTSNNPSREHPSTYFVQDRSNEAEMYRLQIQDQMLTAGMGGVLPEQADPSNFQRVLDVGCGTSGWLIDVARTYPRMSVLVGVDVSSKVIEYARVQAAQQQVGSSTSGVACLLTTRRSTNRPSTTSNSLVLW